MSTLLKNKSTSPAVADPWAIEAGNLPLAFAQVREDPRLDWQLAKDLPTGAQVVMIASGGDTAALLSRLDLRILLVDGNPAQLALTKLKLHLSTLYSAEDIACLLGHSPMPHLQRHQDLVGHLTDLGINTSALGPIERIAPWGPDLAGRYERCFAEIRRQLCPNQLELDRWLDTTDLANAARLISPDHPLGIAIEAAFHTVMSLPNLVQLFGNEATQNPRQTFSDHFIARTRASVLQHAPASNPFLWQVFAGRFPPGHRYDWLDASLPRPVVADVDYQCGPMDQALSQCSATHLIHLSNVLDWLSPRAATTTLGLTHTALRSGGQVVIRQLNSNLDIPTLAPQFRWRQARARSLCRDDRSFFYPAIHIGQRL
jgi:S-adenosylmethionine-diacylglycerol 3-amino-3-carboxypropyl transferase